MILAGQLQTVPSSSAQTIAAVMVSARTLGGYVCVKKDTVGSAAARLLVFALVLVMDRVLTLLVSVTVYGPQWTARSSGLPSQGVQVTAQTGVRALTELVYVILAGEGRLVQRLSTA